MGTEPTKQTITDDRGIERPLWYFPRTRTGVPKGCPISAADQHKVERSMGVHWTQRTPLPDPWLRRFCVIGMVVLMVGTFRVAFLETHREILPIALWMLAAAVLFKSVAGLRACVTYLGAHALANAVLGAEDLSVPDVRGLYGGAGILFGVALLPNWIWTKDLRGKRSRSTRQPWKHMRHKMLDNDRCPSCAHEVRSLNPDTRAWLNCDHCLGLWRAPGFRVPSKPLTPSDCPKCKYNLDGLPVADDLTIRCPECGTYEPAPPILGKAAETRIGSPYCWECKRSLRGLPLTYGDRVQCPDCGQWQSGLTAAEVATPPDP